MKTQDQAAASTSSGEGSLVETPIQDRIQTVGVLGVGQMGSGIALLCARHGFEVRLYEPGDETGARTRAQRHLEAQATRFATSNRLSAADQARLFSRFRWEHELAEIGRQADLIIEAIPENEAEKQALWRRLGPTVKPSAVLATNTSSISVTRLGAASSCPERFIGLHFMNPVAKMKLVEVIRGLATSQATFETVCGFASTLGKTVAVAADFPAFIVNRILLPMINEAVYTLYEGVGTVASIDEALRLGAHHPMGPLALADFIGLDTCLAVMQSLHKELGDPKYRPCPLLTKYVEAGWYGRKKGRGFYDYRQDPPQPTR